MIDFLDGLVILLSTDWFMPHWAVIGISLNESQKGTLQQSCRKVVSQIIGNADTYWSVSFSDQRVDETRSMFMAAVQGIEATQEMACTIKEWLENSDEDMRAGSLYGMITNMLISDNETLQKYVLDSFIRNTLVITWEEDKPDIIDFGELSAKSRSKWDRRVRELTPESPEFVVDILVTFMRAQSFKHLWLKLQSVLTPEQVSELASWYGTVAKHLTHQTISPSYI